MAAIAVTHLADAGAELAERPLKPIQPLANAGHWWLLRAVRLGALTSVVDQSHGLTRRWLVLVGDRLEQHCFLHEAGGPDRRTMAGLRRIRRWPAGTMPHTWHVRRICAPKLSGSSENATGGRPCWAGQCAGLGGRRSASKRSRRVIRTFTDAMTAPCARQVAREWLQVN